MFGCSFNRSTNQFRAATRPQQGRNGKDAGVMLDAARQVVVPRVPCTESLLYPVSAAES